MCMFFFKGFFCLFFLNVDTLDIWDQIILCDGGWPVHCRVFGRVPALDLRDASSTLSFCITAKTISRNCQMSPGWQNGPWLRTTALKQNVSTFHMIT